MSFRCLLGRALLGISGHKVFGAMGEIHQLRRLDMPSLRAYQQRKLERVLLYSFRHVPYYQELLGEHEVVVNGRVELQNIARIPLLTKATIREKSGELRSKQKLPGGYRNTSGGSTGAPVTFVQDRNYDDWNTANKLYFNEIHGKRFGDPEIKLWGSDRDILEGTLGFRERVINTLYNRYFLNTFDMSEDQVLQFVSTINSVKPVAIWGYYDSTFELARFINSRGLPVHSPRVIITTIGKLSSEMRAEIRRAFDCKVIDQYGSREVGALGIEHREDCPLALFPWTHYIEVVDDDGQPTAGEGRIVVTTLENFSMPLIRYEIGDLGVFHQSDNEFPFFHLSEVTGRKFSHFVKRDGTLVHAQFFVTLTFSKPWIKKFQFIQHDLDDIEFLYEPYSDSAAKDIEEIAAAVRKVMGKNCRLRVRETKIDPSGSGKFLYTICKIRDVE